MGKQIYHKQFTGLTAGATAVADMVKKGTILATTIECYKTGDVLMSQTEIATDIELVRIKADNHLLVEAPPAVLDSINKFYNGNKDGGGTAAGFIHIDHARKHLDVSASGAVYGLGTKNIEQITVEVKVKSSSTVLKKLILRGERSDAENDLKTHIQIIPVSIGKETTEQEITEIPDNENNNGYAAVHFNNGNISKMSVRAGSEEVIEELSADLNKWILQKAGRTPQTGYYHVCFDLDNIAESFLPLAGINDLRFKPSFSSAPTGGHTLYLEKVVNITGA